MKIIGATRIRMLQLLMEGRALTAKELAYGARVEPATHAASAPAAGRRPDFGEGPGTSQHFAGIAPGRGAMELLMVLAPDQEGRSVGPRVEASLRRGRMCYDHSGEPGMASPKRW
jgi:hypothetical protein